MACLSLFPKRSIQLALLCMCVGGNAKDIKVHVTVSYSKAISRSTTAYDGFFSRFLATLCFLEGNGENWPVPLTLARYHSILNGEGWISAKLVGAFG